MTTTTRRQKEFWYPKLEETRTFVGPKSDEGILRPVTTMVLQSH